MLERKFETSTSPIETLPVLPILSEYDPTMPSYLSNTPQVALKEILCYLDHKSILLLRKTCHSIRNSINNLKSDLHFTSIHFQLTPYNVFIELFYQEETLRKCVPIWYIKTENGCEIRCGTKKINLENEDFVDIALGDYELFLTYQNKTLDWFKLNLEYFHLDPLADTKVLEPIAQKVLERTETILAKRDRALKTENFRMTVIRQEQAVKILKMIDPKSSKLVSVHGKTLNLSRPPIGCPRPYVSKEQSTVHRMSFPFVLHRQSSFFPLKVQQTRQLRGIGEKSKRAPARQRQSRRQRHLNITPFFSLSLLSHTISPFSNVPSNCPNLPIHFVH